MTDTKAPRPEARRTFPAGCQITNIRNGRGERAGIVYANLVAADGTLLMSATLRYIAEQMAQATILDGAPA